MCLCFRIFFLRFLITLPTASPPFYSIDIHIIFITLQKVCPDFFLLTALYSVSPIKPFASSRLSAGFSLNSCYSGFGEERSNELVASAFGKACSSRGGSHSCKSVLKDIEVLRSEASSPWRLPGKEEKHFRIAPLDPVLKDGRSASRQHFVRREQAGQN